MREGFRPPPEEAFEDDSRNKKESILGRLRKGKLAGALGLGAAAFGVASEVAAQPGKQIEYKEELPDLSKGANDQQTREFVERCGDICGAGALARKIKDLARDAKLGIDDSFTWDIRTYRGRLGPEVRFTVAGDDHIVHFKGTDSRADTAAVFAGQEKWTAERVKNMPLEFSGIIESPSLALTESIKQEAQKSGLKGPLKVNIEESRGSFGAVVKISAKDEGGKEVKWRMSIRRLDAGNQDSADSTIVANIEKGNLRQVEE